MDQKVQELLSERNKIKPTDILCGVSMVEAKGDRWSAQATLEDRMKFSPNEVAGIKPSERVTKSEEVDIPLEPGEPTYPEPSEEDETDGPTE